jgi:hypothetical protein
MSCRHSIFCCAALAMLFCGSAHAAFIVDRENNLDLAPDHIRIFVDEFYPPGEYPTKWVVRDGATGPHDPLAETIAVGAAPQSTLWPHRVLDSPHAADVLPRRVSVAAA